MATGLIYVSSKPLDLHPNSPASKTVKKLMKEITGYLQTYDVIYDDKESRPRGLALSLIVDFASTERQLAHMQPFPAQTRESIDAENKSEAYDEPLVEDPPDLEEVELPPELQPVLMESEPPRALKDIPGYVPYCTDFDPDVLDHKNLPDFDPVEDGEAEFYTDDAITAWIKADQEECARGAKPRLYKSIDMTNDPSGGSNPTEHTSLALAPNLVIYQVPSTKPDGDFVRMCQEYVYMTSLDEYQRVRYFRQEDDPSLPRWLIVQEFDDLEISRWWLVLKKKEAEYLWRKNGWEGVTVEFFRVRGYDTAR